MSNYDLWKEATNKDDVWLMHGDCLEKMNQIESNSIDLIFSDIPYGTTSCKWDVVIPLEQMWANLKRIVKPNGVIVLMAQTPFDKILGASNIAMLKYEWIWEKTSATGHLNAKKMPMKAHENILVFYEKLPFYNPQMTQGHKRKTTKQNREKYQCDIHGKQAGYTEYDSTERYPRSVIKFASDKQKLSLHPTQKPLDLCKYIVETYTKPSDIVLDFTMGSGTVGVACVDLKRKFIGIEKDDHYFNVAKNRIDLVAGF